jgi:Vitamin K-dependent gamma-carboxylase
MSGAVSSQGILGRAVTAWNNFFFKPGDPTTLGLMRLIAGTVVIYVHLAYTPDLTSFFGPKGWADDKLVDDLRRDYPVIMLPSEWDQPNTNFDVPNDRETKKAVFGWIMTLPVNADQRRETLSYLEALPTFPNDSTQALGYVQQLMIKPRTNSPRLTSNDFVLVSADDREQRLNALSREQLTAADKAKIPGFMHGLTVNERKEFRRKVVAFADSLPKDPRDLVIIFRYLSGQAMVPLSVHDSRDPRSALQRTWQFLTEKPGPADQRARGPFLPDDLTERKQVLDYMEQWNIDRRRAQGHGIYIWSVWYHVKDPATMYCIHFAMIGVMALFALGLWTRITSVLTWLSILCYIHRNSYILFGMDTMMNICMIYLTIGPSGATLSLDRWLEKRRAQREFERLRREKKDTSAVEAILAGPRQSVLANFVTRLVQIHFCFIYAASGLSKLKGPAWWGHSAIWMTIANPEFSPTIYAPYRWLLLQLSDHRWLSELMMTFGTFFTLGLEIGFPFLVWRPVLRPYMVILAVLLHTGIAVFMGLTVFGLFMMVLLLAFVPPDTVTRWLELGEQRLKTKSSTPILRQPLGV